MIDKLYFILERGLSDIKQGYFRRKVRAVSANGVMAAAKSRKILFWSTGGYVSLLNIESLIGYALKLRGFNVHFVICDGSYRACARRQGFTDVPLHKWQETCEECRYEMESRLKIMGFEYSHIEDLVPERDRAALKEQAQKITLENYMDMTFGEIELGKNLLSTMIRQMMGGSFADREDLLKEFAFTALMVAHASNEAIARTNPLKIYMSHGIYADWGPALSVCLDKKIPVVSYVSAYLPGHFVFKCTTKLSELCQQLISDEAWEKISKTTLTKTQEKRLDDFLENRYKKCISQDIRKILKKYNGDTAYFYEKYKLDRTKPVWGIMTHINWDSISEFFSTTHGNFDDWLCKTIQEITRITDVQWLIKIHPGEALYDSRTGAQELIRNSFPELPPHVKIIKMDDEINPLDFYNLLDGGVTVLGTSGLELALMGKPVILAGEAHYGKKGFTYDAADPAHYTGLLNMANSINPLSAGQVGLARRYAYCLFIQRQVPLFPVLNENWGIDFGKIESLLPGRNKIIDFICDRIIDGKDFIMDESLVESIR